MDVICILYWTSYVLCCEHSLNSKQPVNNVTVLYERVCVYECASLCMCVYTSACLLCAVFVLEGRVAPWCRVAGRRGFPWSLSIIQSGVALLAIISPVRSTAVPPPPHISLCHFTCCLWMEPWSMKPHVTVIITFSDICCFS